MHHCWQVQREAHSLIGGCSCSCGNNGGGNWPNCNGWSSCSTPASMFTMSMNMAYSQWNVKAHCPLPRPTKGPTTITSTGNIRLGSATTVTLSHSLCASLSLSSSSYCSLQRCFVSSSFFSPSTHCSFNVDVSSSSSASLSHSCSTSGTGVPDALSPTALSLLICWARRTFSSLVCFNSSSMSILSANWGRCSRSLTFSASRAYSYGKSRAAPGTRSVTLLIVESNSLILLTQRASRSSHFLVSSVNARNFSSSASFRSLYSASSASSTVFAMPLSLTSFCLTDVIDLVSSVR